MFKIKKCAEIFRKNVEKCAKIFKNVAKCFEKVKNVQKCGNFVTGRNEVEMAIDSLKLNKYPVLMDFRQNFSKK